ncbi:MAG: ATP-binding protein [Cyanobacteria bacterium J06638_22]
MIDRIAAAIQAATQKEVLVIIDDLDKLDLPLVISIYRDNINALISPGIQVVFTIPISVVRDVELTAVLESHCQKLVQFSVTKFYAQDQAHLSDGEAIEANIDILLRILQKRIAPDLIGPDVMRQLVLLSGGVLRELIRLGQECCRECMLELSMNPDKQDVTIDTTILATAVKNIRNQFARSLGSNLYKLLGEIYGQFAPPDARDPDFLELLHGLYVLEYENEDLWYDLHPLITDLLRRKKILPPAGESA